MAVVHVPPSEATEVAQQLLRAAADLGLDPTTTVKTSTDGFFGLSFVVPDEVYDRAGFNRIADAAPAKEPQEPAPKPKNKGGRPRKAAAEPVVEEQE
jgi:hypothetical protein